LTETCMQRGCLIFFTSGNRSFTTYKLLTTR
jgi:hypothetical protein